MKPSVRISRKLVSALFFSFVLFISSGAMETFTSSSTPGEDASGSPMMKVMWAITYLVVLILLLKRRSEVVRMLSSNKAYTALVMLAVLSVLWSIDAGATVAKGVPLLLSGLIGLEFARRYTIREQLQLIWRVLAVVLVLGVIAQIFFPGLVPNPGTDEMAATAWRGIVTTKNAWARLIVLTGVVILSFPRPTRSSVFRVGFLMALIFCLLVASRSTGGLLIMAEMTVLFFLFRILRWKRKKALVLLSISGAALILVAGNLVLQNFTQFMNVLGKDPTMTGRLPIWRECLHFVGMKPFLGYGYGAFWTVTSHPARLIREAVDWDTLPHAHNGYIDLLLALGGVGLLLYAVVNCVAGWRAVLHVREYADADAMWPLAFVCVTLLYQLNEASIISANQLIWILFSSVIFSLGIEARQRAAAGVPAEEESYAAQVPAGG